MKANQDQGRNLEIEALRGVAILLVLFAHIGTYLFFGRSREIYENLRPWIQAGTGVDLFFCISGYVITRSVISSVPENRSLVAFLGFACPFWIRRFWRLAPSAWLWVMITLLLSVVQNDPAWLADTVRDGLAAILNVANFRVYECVARINATSCGPMVHYWSLSLEEQFYLAFPFILFFIPRRHWLATFGGVALVQIAIPRTFADLPWLVRTDAIALGACLALLRESSAYELLRPTFLHARSARWAWMLTLLALLAVVDAPKVHFVQFTFGLVAVISAALVWTASFEGNYATPSRTVKRALIYIGQRSYALYLIHSPASAIILTVPSLFGFPPDLFKPLIFPVIFALAELNYRIVEAPLRRYGSGAAERFRARTATVSGHDAVIIFNDSPERSGNGGEISSRKHGSKHICADLVAADEPRIDADQATQIDRRVGSEH